MDYLSGSLLDEIGDLIMISVTRINSVEKGKRSDRQEAEELALSIIQFIDSLFGNDGTSPFCKYTVMLYGAMAVLFYEDDDLKKGEVYLQEAFGGQSSLIKQSIMIPFAIRIFLISINLYLQMISGKALWMDSTLL